MSFSYANPGSGPSAGGIGWFNFGSGFTITPGQTVTGLTGTLANGITVTFDLTLSFLGGAPRNFTAVPAPASATAYFGSAGYTGIAGNPVLYSDFGTANNLSSLTLTNISVKDALGNTMPNYTVVLADGESTSGDPIFQEGLSFTTNGGAWTQLAALGATNPPTIVGGGNFIGFIGVSAPPNTAYVYTTQSPSQVTASLQEALANTRQGVAIGFAATQIQLYKTLTGRRDAADQFELSISGNPSNTATTTGAATGLQTEYATIAAIPGNTYTLTELMAPGSVSALTDYTQTVSAVNLTVGGTVPPVGPLPETITPALGDVIQYTILNVADEIFTKTVDKAYAKPGDVLTYTVSVDNPNNFVLNNVQVTDSLPAGTTYVGNLIVSTPYTGTDPMSGLVLTSIPADTTATVTWQVKVNSVLPTPNPIVNIADVVVPGGNSGSTNPITTQINSADLVSPGNFIKSVNPVVASPGDVVTYTISVTNTGNVAANNVVITDILPAGTTYIAGSISSNVSFTGDPTGAITLTAPLAAGNNATFTFQVKLGNTVPAVNPVDNQASISYAYTVDPAVPNGATGSGQSNVASVTVGSAQLQTTKTASKTIAYKNDIITYNFAIVNKGNVAADQVVITDPIPVGTTYVAGSLTSNVAVSGSPETTITLTNPVLPGETVVLSFQIQVTGVPIPNPIKNIATLNYAYTVDPQNPDSVEVTSTSTVATTAVFENNYSQQISDLIQSVALEEAALAAIANSEGAKIQKMVAMNGITPEELICLNKSVSDMLESLSLLESILKQKLNTVSCQINGPCL